MGARSCRGYVNRSATRDLDPLLGDQEGKRDPRRVGCFRCKIPQDAPGDRPGSPRFQTQTASFHRASESIGREAQLEVHIAAVSYLVFSQAEWQRRYGGPLSWVGGPRRASGSDIQPRRRSGRKRQDNGGSRTRRQRPRHRPAISMANEAAHGRRLRPNAWTGCPKSAATGAEPPGVEKSVTEGNRKAGPGIGRQMGVAHEPAARRISANRIQAERSGPVLGQTTVTSPHASSHRFFSTIKQHVYRSNSPSRPATG